MAMKCRLPSSAPRTNPRKLEKGKMKLMKNTVSTTKAKQQNVRNLWRRLKTVLNRTIKVKSQRREGKGL